MIYNQSDNKVSLKTLILRIKSCDIVHFLFLLDKINCNQKKDKKPNTNHTVLLLDLYLNFTKKCKLSTESGAF